MMRNVVDLLQLKNIFVNSRRPYNLEWFYNKSLVKASLHPKMFKKDLGTLWSTTLIYLYRDVYIPLALVASCMHLKLNSSVYPAI